MKALSLTQPYATLVSLGAKRIETRSWATSYRGRLLIHAAKGMGPVGGNRGLNHLVANEPFWSVLQAAGCTFGRRAPSGLPFGAIVAVCDLVDCVSTGLYPVILFQRSVQHGSEIWQVPPGNMSREYSFGDYSPGRYAWLLADVQAFPESVECKGALGLWKPDAATMEAVMQQVKV